jgi:hypothetical protein
LIQLASSDILHWLDKLLRACKHLTGQRVIPAFDSSVTSPTSIRMASRKKAHILALAITLLALGLFVQAVHAKNSDYFPDTVRSVRFSTTIKIADLVQHVVFASPVAIVVSQGHLASSPPQPDSWLFTLDVPAPTLHAQLSLLSPRSPPINL